MTGVVVVKESSSHFATFVHRVSLRTLPGLL
jgi:hypothetical protein